MGLTEAVNMAITENTKSQYKTAMNHVERCKTYTNKNMDFPFDLSKTLNYVGFLMEVRKVSSNTISQYLSALRFLHLVEGADPSSLRPSIVTLILRGREHWEHVENTLSNKPKRVAITVPMMKYIKRSLINMPCSEEEKLLIWAVCTLMFCGSLRVHEILSKETVPCPHSTLFHEDLQVTEISINGNKKTIIKLRLKSPKENRIGNGVCLEIFGNDTFMCPARALKKWLARTKTEPGKPLFRFPNKESFKGKDLKKILSKITDHLTEGSTGIVRSHSFRAAISTEMGLRGFSSEEIQAQGRWTSSAFKNYLKKDPVKRLQFTEKWINKIVHDN